MGQYRVSFYFEIQIALGLRYIHGYTVEIYLPFVAIYIGLMPGANGIRLFNWNPEK